MVEVEVRYQNTVHVAASPVDAWALLSDVQRSGLHFPDVDTLQPSPRGPGAWTWTMKEKGLGPITLRVQYDATYEADPDAQSVCWHPTAKGSGDMDSYGSWTLSPAADGGTELAFEARTVAYVKASRLVSKMVEVVAREELSKLKARYVEAIKRTLDA